MLYYYYMEYLSMMRILTADLKPSTMIIKNMARRDSKRFFFFLIFFIWGGGDNASLVFLFFGKILSMTHFHK